jgi:hypothetical protein
MPKENKLYNQVYNQLYQNLNNNVNKPTLGTGGGIISLISNVLQHLC